MLLVIGTFGLANTGDFTDFAVVIFTMLLVIPIPPCRSDLPIRYRN